MLKVADLVKQYGKPYSRQGSVVLDGVNLEIGKGQTLGLVGGSGAGKSTLARCILGLEKPTRGHIYFLDREITRLTAKELRQLRRRIQIVWQDPYASLNPYMRLNQLIREPLENYYPIDRNMDLNKRVSELLDQVGLGQGIKYKYPHELSGGQCQRAAIARALALNPDFLICDEPLSSLDTPKQLHILNLLRDMQIKLGLTCLFITHDLSVARHFCSRIAVIYRGRIVEEGNTEEIFLSPKHHYTRLLIDSLLHMG